MNNKVTIGLYRHFKGGYYYVTGVSKSATDEKTLMVNYFNVCHPEYGSFVRPLDDFVTDREEDGRMIVDRPDNVTGQICRLERVKDLNFQLGSVSTEQIVEELRHRKDSPIHELDIEGLQSNIYSKDYVIGELYEQTEDTPKGVYTVATFDSEKKAKDYYLTHQHKRNAVVLKRTFIKV